MEEFFLKRSVLFYIFDLVEIMKFLILKQNCHQAEAQEYQPFFRSFDKCKKKSGKMVFAS